MKSHTDLLKALENLKVEHGVHGHCNTLETYGRRTFAYIVWKSTAHRAQGELLLSDDFPPNRRYSPGTVYSEVPVSTTKARKLKYFNTEGPYGIR